MIRRRLVALLAALALALSAASAEAQLKQWQIALKTPGNSTCTASGVPYACCTGNTTGTCGSGGLPRANVIDEDLIGCDCTTTAGTCVCTHSSKFFTEDDTIVPTTASKLPTSGTWTVGKDIIQVSADPDSGSDVARKSWADTHNLDVKCWTRQSPTSADTITNFWVPSGQTVTVVAFNCIAQGSSTPTIAVTLKECDSSGANCGTGSVVNEAVTCDDTPASGNNTGDGAIGNPDVAGPAWMQVVWGNSTSGTVTWASLCAQIQF